MKIEVGKSYPTRGGDMAKITEYVEGRNFPYGGDIGGAYITWTGDGHQFQVGHSGFDLLVPIGDDSLCAADVSSAFNAQAEKMGTPVNEADDSDDYSTLHNVLREAFNQSAHGKGKERHANDKPFDRQPIMEVGRTCGVGFPVGQAIKKAGEAIGMLNRGERDAAARELLGSIVYAAAAVALIKEGGE